MEFGQVQYNSEMEYSIMNEFEQSSALKAHLTCIYQVYSDFTYVEQQWNNLSTKVIDVAYFSFFTKEHFAQHT